MVTGRPTLARIGVLRADSDLGKMKNSGEILIRKDLPSTIFTGERICGEMNRLFGFRTKSSKE